MKKCPFCQTPIEDEARFCFYCMTSLDEKEPTPSVGPRRGRGWLYVALLLVAVLVAGIILLFAGRGEESGQVGFSPTANTPTDRQQAPSSQEYHQTGQASTSSREPADSVNDQSMVTPQPTTPPSGMNSQGGSSQSALPSQPVHTPTTSQPESQSSQPVESVPPLTQTAVYRYRDAKPTDDFNLSAAFTQNAVVITDVVQPSADGTYTIPTVLDGKRVVAIMPNAFASVRNEATCVIIPDSVKTVWNNAFADCVKLSHVYLEGKAIYIEALAFDRAGEFTLHCAADCSDRNYRYYKNTASQYGAVYEEWNGRRHDTRSVFVSNADHLFLGEGAGKQKRR